MSGPGVKRRALPRYDSDEVRDDRTTSQVEGLLKQRIEALDFIVACLQQKAYFLNSVLISNEDIRRAQENSGSMLLRAQAFAVLAVSAGRVLSFEDGVPALRAAAQMMHEFEEWCRGIGTQVAGDDSRDSLWVASSLASSRSASPAAPSAATNAPRIAQAAGTTSSRAEAMALARQERARRTDGEASEEVVEDRGTSAAASRATDSSGGTVAKEEGGTEGSSSSRPESELGRREEPSVGEGVSERSQTSATLVCPDGLLCSAPQPRGDNWGVRGRELHGGSRVAAVQGGAGPVSASSASLVGVGSSIRRFLFGAATPGGLYPEAVTRAVPTEPVIPQSWEHGGRKRLECLVGVPAPFAPLSYRESAIAACQTLAQVYKKLLAGPWASASGGAGAGATAGGSGSSRFVKEIQVVDRQLKHHSIKPIAMDLGAIARARIRVDCALAAEASAGTFG